jgi:predicted nucleic acid-binding protein
VILADTSVWIDHLRQGDGKLADLLDHRQIVMHPFVIGELALGHLKPRDQILCALGDLPQTILASEAEVLSLIEGHVLFGKGIGYIDAHLLTASLLTPGTRIWTREKQLLAAASKLALAA